MRFQTLGFASAAALALSSAATLAADLPSRVAPPAFVAPLPVANWAGFYAGTLYGYGFSTVRTRQVGTARYDIDGQTGGPLLGYNWEFNRFVVGLEGDITLSVLRGTNGGNAGVIPTATDSLFSGHARARLGYDFGDLLPFVAGGYALNETYVRNLAPLADFGQNHRQSGYTVGAGLDYKFLLPIIGPVAVRAEYLYESFGDRTYNLIGGPVRDQQSTSYVRVGLISRFGEGAPHPAYVDPEYGVNWAGAYGGLLGGYSSINARTRFGGLNNTITADGGFGGIYTGRNFQFGRFVVGFDGSTTLTDQVGRGVEPASANAFYRNYIDADIRGRVGYSFGRFLPFLAAGADFTRSEQRDDTTRSQRGRIPSDGYTVGGGLDYKITDNVSGRLEYKYVSSVTQSKVFLNGLNQRQQQDTQTVRVGAAYHFQ